MSGHSKWAQIKRQKGATDAKRAITFTKLAAAITVAAKEGGGDPESNFRLRLALEKARAVNMPKENMTRAIQRGTGELSEKNLFEVIYEGFGPYHVAVMIHVLTDNKNRIVSQLKHLLSKYHGSLGVQKSVSWMFEPAGIIVLRPSEGSTLNTEDVQLLAMEQNARDIAETQDGGLVITTAVAELQAMKTALEQREIPIESADIEYIPKEQVHIEGIEMQETLEKFFDELNELEDVVHYYSNES